MLLQAHDRLVVQLELVGLDRVLQFRTQLEPLDDPFVHHRLEDAVTALAVALGHVHRDVGVPEELGGVGRSGAPVDEADSDTRAWEDLFALDLRRNLECLEDARGRVGGLGRVGDAFEENRELVASEASERVGRAHGDQQPSSDLLENPVAGLVAETVVDRLEVVQVDEHDRDVGEPTLRSHQRMLDAIREQRSVGEARHRIVEGLMRELLLERLPLAHIAAVQDDAANVLVMTEIRVLHLELQTRSVQTLERALEGMAVGAAGAVAGDQLP